MSRAGASLGEVAAKRAEDGHRVRVCRGRDVYVCLPGLSQTVTVRQLRRKHHRAQSSCPLSEVCELSTEMGDWSSYQSTTEPRRTVHDAVLRGSQIVAKGSFVKMEHGPVALSTQVCAVQSSACERFAR